MSTVIIYGPPASGKSQISETVADLLGCTSIVDEWSPQDALITGSLHLTQADRYQLAHMHVRLDEDLNAVHLFNIEALKLLLPGVVKK